jgi:hypothetical protein
LQNPCPVRILKLFKNSLEPAERGLERFKIAFPKYQNYKLYGAVAGIKIDERSDIYATQEGLFLIEPVGDSVIIANSQKVKPRIW